MKQVLLLCALIAIVCSCEQPRALSSTNPVNWEKRMVKTALPDSLETGSTFLSIYSQIHVRNENEFSTLTATVSLHNPNRIGDLFIDAAVYYDTNGAPIRTYFEKTILIKPMETVQIIIDDKDDTGGTGANFVFDWQKLPKQNAPIFEAIMISTYGQQGISFVTVGKELK
jgi:hypothetical protein